MINILYQDKAIIVCEKPIGVLSERGQNTREKCMPNMLEKLTKTYRIDVVHRLDKAVGGLMVFSKNSKASAGLSVAIASHKMKKQYLAVVAGCPEEKEGQWCDFLFRDKSKNKSFVVKKLRTGAKEAILNYKVLDTIEVNDGVVSLLQISLQTGRTHQIRVQCASRKMPLLGDEKYGSRIHTKNIALWSNRLAFDHPVTKKPIDITLDPPKTEPWIWFNKETLQLIQCSHHPY